MTNSPAEPTNLVLEQLRLMLAETVAMRAERRTRFDQMGAKLEALDARVGRVEKELRGLEQVLVIAASRGRPAALHRHLGRETVSSPSR
jgi:hypothetical protein